VDVASLSSLTPFESGGRNTSSRDRNRDEALLALALWEAEVAEIRAHAPTLSPAAGRAVCGVLASILSEADTDSAITASALSLLTALEIPRNRSRPSPTRGDRETSIDHENVTRYHRTPRSPGRPPSGQRPTRCFRAKRCDVTWSFTGFLGPTRGTWHDWHQ
jgi:hypothetical protein